MTNERKEARKRQSAMDKAEHEVNTTGSISKETAAVLKERGIDAEQITARLKSIAIKSTATKCVVGINRAPQADIPSDSTTKP